MICPKCGVDSPNPLFCSNCSAPMSLEGKRVVKMSMEQRLAKQGIEMAKKLNRKEKN